MTLVAVGSNEHNTPVQFFSLDLKKDKAAVAKLKKLVAKEWLNAVHAFEIDREDAADVLDDNLIRTAGVLEDWLSMRRFLANALQPYAMKKTKRTLLLFHHSDANAPAGSDELHTA